MFGKIISYEIDSNKINIKFEDKIGSIEIITPDIINIFSSFRYEDHFSRAIEDLKTIECNFDIKRENDYLEVVTDKLIVKIYDNFKVDFYNKDLELLCGDYRGERKPLVRCEYNLASIEDHKVEESTDELNIQVIKKLKGDEKFYGLGDKTGYLNKRGYEYEMWNTDEPMPHVESFKALYKSIPFFIALTENNTFGIFFDNNFKTHFDMGKENEEYYYFGSNDGNLDYYFINGNNMMDVVGGYTYLTGKTPLPQMWTLGYQQSRWSYYPESRVKEIAEGFRKNDIPCDVIHLDIDYMEKYKVFTWDKEKFSDPNKFLSDFKDDGFKVVTIIDPGVKKEKGYDIYEEGMRNRYFATDKDGITYVNKVWPGDAVYPDFSNSKARTWWAENQKIMMDAGVSGIWNDMNEPASFNGPLPDDVQFNNEGRGGDHTEIHNIYGHLMSKATYEGIKKITNKRPFVITRACYAGSQKYSTVWTGDNQSFWEHLRMSIPMLCNLGLSGFSFSGVDVGGFSADCTKELLSRWVQVGCFSTLFRNHSSMPTRDQEPWAFDEQTLNINRKYIKLRYKLIPYLYDTLWQGETTGLPVMRPLVLHYSNDKNVHEINDEFLFGENILVSPVVEQGKRTKEVYLPNGVWIDYWTKEEIIGGKSILREAPLDLCPMYIKKGSIIPNYPEQRYIGDKQIKELTFDVYPGEAEYIHYVDDGETFEYKDGKYNLYQFNMTENEDKLNIEIKTPYLEYENKYDTFKIILNNLDINKVKFNNMDVEYKENNKSIQVIIPAIQGILSIKKK
ncbi:glycoside hydrolase family 31 protein [Clostridium uliginosum]|uniref:Alpha-glucosidase n=1 Tax=Clostridium uliginosum TaxID=119641 RepID=A0A1I1PLU9_9CLOT|nr:glycoside hydrolase family 31 protein [Clostridium uliginosum]SFD06980.1 alpha-glucosidase [Clostridium uliginosum]